MLKALLVVILILAVAVAVAMAYGAFRWKSDTVRLRERLERARSPVRPRVVDFREIEGLPTPVQRYFRTVIVEGRHMVSGVRIHHRGTFNMGESSENWRPFTSDQKVVTRRPGFDWDARIEMMPGLRVMVHDAYVAGEGILQASVLGLFPVAGMRGTRDVAEGELMRFLAEAAWYPTALLPGQGVRWEAIDVRSARATLADGPITITMQFTFNDDDLIETVRAEERGRTVGAKVIPTPWQGRFWDYEGRSGMIVPLEGEVAWLHPEGARPYWRGRITRAEYEFAE